MIDCDVTHLYADDYLQANNVWSLPIDEIKAPRARRLPTPM